jgi:hypothetical protein
MRAINIEVILARRNVPPRAKLCDEKCDAESDKGGIESPRS